MASKRVSSETQSGTSFRRSCEGHRRAARRRGEHDGAPDRPVACRGHDHDRQRLGGPLLDGGLVLTPQRHPAAVGAAQEVAAVLWRGRLRRGRRKRDKPHAETQRQEDPRSCHTARTHVTGESAAPRFARPSTAGRRPDDWSRPRDPGIRVACSCRRASRGARAEEIRITNR